MKAFCFSEEGKELSILRPDPNTDFFLFLTDFAKQHGHNIVAVTYKDLQQCRLGIKDLLNYGLRVVVVDQVYSPISDTPVIPVWVHRNALTLQQYYPDCIVIGELIPIYQRLRQLELIKTYFQDGVPLVNMDALKSGWVITRTTGNSEKINSRIYEYVTSRDYELEINSEKRNSR